MITLRQIFKTNRICERTLKITQYLAKIWEKVRWRFVYGVSHSKSQRLRSSVRRATTTTTTTTTTLPSRTSQSGSDTMADVGHMTSERRHVTSSVAGCSAGRRRARSCIDCRDTSTTLSHSAPDLFTIATSLTADPQTSGNTTARDVDVKGTELCSFAHAPCELCTECTAADCRVAALTQLRPLMDTPV